MSKIAYGFVHPDDLGYALENAYLVETFRGESGISDFWMKFPDGQVVAYSRLNREAGYIHDIQTRAEKLGIGSKFLELLRTQIPDIKSTGTATVAGAKFINRNNIPVDDTPHFPVSPMRFVFSWEHMTPQFSCGYDREMRPSEEVPRHYRNDYEAFDKWRQGSRWIPAEHLSSGDTLVKGDIKINCPSSEDGIVYIFISREEEMEIPFGTLVEVYNN